MTHNEITQHYIELANKNGDFPYIQKQKVIILKEGFYHKREANYKGLSYIYNGKEKRSMCILMGFFFVPKNYVVVYPEVLRTVGKEKLIQDKIKEGYILLDKMPSLPILEFPEESHEYEITKASYDNLKNKSNDTSNNFKERTPEFS